MNRNQKKRLRIACCMLAAFALWTAAVCSIDVQPIGPQSSSIGFATINHAFHRLTGVQMSLYIITDWLSIIPIAIAMGFAVLGLIQWIKRRSLFKVDHDLLVLGGFYAAVASAFIFFELFIINFRPILIDSVLEASYPSSTTMLVLCVMSTTIMQLRTRIKCTPIKQILTFIGLVFTCFMLIGRLLSGVHWLSDIIGGALLSAGLVMMYDFVIHVHPPFSEK